MKSFTLRIGGEAGMGTATAADLFAKIALKLGYHVFSSKDYCSQIRGGHNFHTVRISKEKVLADVQEINILLALDRQTLEKHIDLVTPNGIVIYNSNLNITKKEKIHFIPIEINALESELDEKNLLNVIFLGATIKCLGIDQSVYETILEDSFSHKFFLLNQFRKASLLGYNHVEKIITLPNPGHEQKIQLINGNDAISLGALRAGITFHAQYPMTPVTGILHYLEKESTTNKKLVVIQPEDEISTINMALGASYAGARAMTATSGGGFALMTESISLAGMAEIPLVIIEGQRPGPATGLPTKTGQDDLKFVVNAGHGEFPKVVIAPGNIEECYTETKRAFYLAERYQLPVIVLVDKHLTESFKDVNLEDEEKKFTFNYNTPINLVNEPKENQINEEGLFKRYSGEERVIPGTKKGIYTCAGDEHNEVGTITEDYNNRIRMVDRRSEKLNLLQKELPSLQLIGTKDADLTIVSWGSNKGAIEEAIKQISNEGKEVNFLNLKYLFPFQKEEVLSLLQQSKKLLLIENNSTGQLGQLISENTGVSIKNQFLKYNGQTFMINELVTEIKKWLN
jgi:2-oxoglutarate/2-oxoacid ferredoxin oxidoreductase subunit alpha